jgi:hypothetical protein
MKMFYTSACLPSDIKADIVGDWFIGGVEHIEAQVLEQTKLGVFSFPELSNIDNVPYRKNHDMAGIVWM